MSRKVFISILGTGFYSKCKYAKDDFCSSETRFVQMATLEYIGAKKWSDTDTAIILLTEGAEKVNWDITGRVNYQGEKMKYSGLKLLMKNFNSPLIIQSVSIPDGKSEQEMWSIFSIIYEKLQEGDELYFDLTHSFRYLPMLLLVLSNYSKFLKKVTVKHISYGNYETREIEKNEAPIIDLLPISYLQDWTFAAADFLENGNTSRLSDLSFSILQPLLRDSNTPNESARQLNSLIKNIRLATEDIQTCRGMDIIESNNIEKVNKLFSKVKTTFIEPLNPIIQKMSDFFQRFDNNRNIQNGFIAAEWCFNNGLYQQTVTMLQENVVSYFCERHGLQIDDENKRGIINKALHIAENEVDEAEWIIEEENKEILKSILKDDLLTNKELTRSFARLTRLRNDINHFGMRSQKVPPLSSRKIKDSIQREMTVIFNLK